MDELDELRLRIARVKGWSFWTLVDRTIMRSFNFGDKPPREVMIAGSVDHEFELKYCDDFPDWPRDIAAAWELVEEISKTDYFIKISSPQETGGKWLVKIDQKGWGDNNPPPPGGWWFGMTAPEAICRAWLAWKDVN